jgi:uncharacterized protein (TIGR02246 family)
MSGNGSARQAIEQVNRQFEQAFNQGNAAGTTKVYTEDARLMPPGMPLMQGHQAIQQFWQGGMDMGIHKVELHTDYFEERGELAYEIGHAVLHIKSQDGQALTDTVKFVVVWKQESGSWKWAVDIWNSNA